jgi:hypothetical protein
MKKSLVLIIGAIMLAVPALLIESCAVNDAQPAPEATVQNHFFPLDNGLVYTYSRFNHNTFDTLTCRLVIGQTPSEQNTLLDSKTDSAVYYLGYTHDANGNLAAVLSSGDTTLLALDGQLQIGATWVADEVHNIRATVLDHYDDYYLPGRLVHFPDVLAVEYHQDGSPDNVYTLRYFARGQGLVFERELVGSNTEIASLQLLSVEYPSYMQHRGIGQIVLPQSIIASEIKN